MSLRFFLPMLLALLIPGVLPAQQYCLAQDTVGTSFFKSIQRNASSTAAPYVDARVRSGLPLTPAANVTYVTDESVCQKIAAAITADVRNSDKTPSNRVRAVKVGTVYVAQDPAVKTPLDIWTFYFSKNFKITKRFGR